MTAFIKSNNNNIHINNCVNNNMNINNNMNSVIPHTSIKLYNNLIPNFKNNSYYKYYGSIFIRLMRPWVYHDGTITSRVMDKISNRIYYEESERFPINPYDEIILMGIDKFITFDHIYVVIEFQSGIQYCKLLMIQNTGYENAFILSDLIYSVSLGDGLYINDVFDIKPYDESSQ